MWYTRICSYPNAIYSAPLRKRSESFRLIRSTIFGAILTWLHMSDYRNFRTLNMLNDGGFKLIVLHSTIVSGTETSSKMASTLYQKSRVLRTIQFCSNSTSMCYKYFERNVWRDFRVSVSALRTVPQKEFLRQIYCKICFSIGPFMLLLLMITSKVW